MRTDLADIKLKMYQLYQNGARPENFGALKGDTEMTEQEIMNWMHDKVKRDGFTDAASLAEEFLQTHNVTDTLDPDFSRTLDAGFKIAQEIHSF